VKQRTELHQPTLFFNWIPNTLTAPGNFTRVNFPSCKTGGVVLDDHGQPVVGCDFEVNQLSKFIWVRMRTHTPEAYRLITSMQFSQAEYEKLLRLNVHLNPNYADDASYYDETACQWVLENERRWTRWLPANLSSKTKIYLGGMFPETGPYWRQPGIAPGKNDTQ
jgi:ABC-type proline/glycine betaine transport system substrate-binding protein